MEAIEIVAIAEEPCYITASWDKDFAIVGFDKDSKDASEDCVDETILKPRSCGGACICLCDGGIGDVSGDDCKPEDCKPTTDFEVFQYPKSEEPGFGNLVIYNKNCGNIWREGTNSYLLEKEDKTLKISLLDDVSGKKSCPLLYNDLRRQGKI